MTMNGRQISIRIPSEFFCWCTGFFPSYVYCECYRKKKSLLLHFSYMLFFPFFSCVSFHIFHFLSWSFSFFEKQQMVSQLILLFWMGSLYVLSMSFINVIFHQRNYLLRVLFTFHGKTSNT